MFEEFKKWFFSPADKFDTKYSLNVSYIYNGKTFANSPDINFVPSIGTLIMFENEDRWLYVHGIEVNYKTNTIKVILVNPEEWK